MSEEGLQIEMDETPSRDTGSSGSRDSKPKVRDFGDEVSNFIITALKQNGQDFYMPAYSEDAEPLSEQLVEYLNVEDGSTKSVEGVFGIDIERELIGDPTVTMSVEEFEESDIDEEDVEFTDDGNVKVKLTDIPGTGQVDRHIKIELSKFLNGYHSDDVVEAFGENAKVTVGIAASRAFDDPLDRARHVRFYVTETENAPRSRLRAQLDVGVIETSGEYERSCLRIGLPPYPRFNTSDSTPGPEVLLEKHKDELSEEVLQMWSQGPEQAE